MNVTITEQMKVHFANTLSDAWDKYVHDKNVDNSHEGFGQIGGIQSTLRIIGGSKLVNEIDGMANAIREKRGTRKVNPFDGREML
jgi:hypothetical protein